MPAALAGAWPSAMDRRKAVQIVRPSERDGFLQWLMSQPLTMPIGGSRDKICGGGFLVVEKTSKVIRRLADFDTVQRGREAVGTRETPKRFSSGMDAV